jgi:serine/threonine protein kinase
MSDVPVASALVPGDPTEIDGYRVDGRLGEGGQGVVFLATAPDGLRVAIKRLRPGVVDDGTARQRLAKEVAAARQVAPFCTARVIDAHLHGDHPHVVTEYIDGPSLQRRVQDGGPVTGAELFRLAVGTATALAAIHQAGVVHRDFKPANVMLAADGPRVIDFGIARDLTQETTVTSRVFGTPAYMAPEQVSGERSTTATDIFAWASTMIYAATGEAPFDAPHMVAVVHRITYADPDLSAVPPALADVVRRCLAKEPADRPSAQHVVQLLLGRPLPGRDLSDPTSVLAEATRVAASTTSRPPMPPASASATATQPRPPLQLPPAAPAEAAWWAPQPAAPAPADAGNGRPLAPRPAPPRAPMPNPATRDVKRRPGPFIATMLVAVLAAGGVATAMLVNDWNERDQRRSTAGPTTGPTGEPAGVTPSPSETDDASPSTDDATTPSTTPSETDDEDVTIPNAFDGTWVGLASQPRGTVRSWQARLVLEKRETVGRFEIPTLGCSGAATVVEASSKLLVLETRVTEDPESICADRGTVVLQRLNRQAANFLWQDAARANNRATGLLLHTD